MSWQNAGRRRKAQCLPEADGTQGILPLKSDERTDEIGQGWGDSAARQVPTPTQPYRLRFSTREAQVNVAKTRKVLVVEDSKLIHKMYEVMLRPCMLIAAHDGREGLARLDENPDVDVIILDINMPHMTGLQFLGQVKGKPEFAQIPVIIVSTEGKEEDVARGLQAGAVAYLKKPFQREDLLKIIGKFATKQASA
jgi:CheY-like chemotaxis protein